MDELREKSSKCNVYFNSKSKRDEKRKEILRNVFNYSLLIIKIHS